MDRQDSWKRTEEIEIDLADLLHRLCMQWKRMAVCALAAAVLMGAYVWLKSRPAAQNAVSEKTGSESVLTETEEQAVADAVMLKNEISSLEEYLDSSVLMQIDAYHKNRNIMLYRIDHAERQELPVITENYLSFLVNGGAADALQKTGSGRQMDKSCLAELITAYQKTYSSPYQVIVQDAAVSGMMAESLFYAEITGRSAEEAQEMALDLQKVLKEYSDEVEQNAGSHRLVLISSMESVTMDSGLQSQQHDKKAALSSNRSSLKAVTDNFSEEQLKAYQKETDAVHEKSGDTDKVSDDSVPAAIQGRLADMIKYLAAGVFAGIFAYGCFFSGRYIFKDTIKSVKEMKRRYTFPVFGGITEEQTFHRIRLACQRKGIKKLCAAYDSQLNEKERDYLENLKRQLSGMEIGMSVAGDIGRDTAEWDNLTAIGNVLMICKEGVTTHRMIDDAMSFYLQNGIFVMGAAVISQNE